MEVTINISFGAVGKNVASAELKLSLVGHVNFIELIDFLEPQILYYNGNSGRQSIMHALDRL